MAARAKRDCCDSTPLAFGTEVVSKVALSFRFDTFRETWPMRLARMVLLLSFVTLVLMVAAGGKFHIGIPLAVALTFLFCLLEPSIA